jgi:hypothetical protein
MADVLRKIRAVRACNVAATAVICPFTWFNRLLTERNIYVPLRNPHEAAVSKRPG